MTIREPAVAGMFYQADGISLREQVESCFLGEYGPGSLPVINKQGQRKTVGLVSPHAGLIYSGSVAAWDYSRLAEDGLPDTAVLIGPNHRSYFPSVAISDAEAWQTPMGKIEVDTAVAHAIASEWEVIKMNQSVHEAEHSLEVQLPFLQYLSQIGQKNVRIVPILIGSASQSEVPGGEMEVAHRLGEAVAHVLQGRNAVVIASTDFTHYENGESAHAKDSRAISAILALDEQALLDTVHKYDITMCGYLPTAVTIVASKILGATAARELAYQNSGDVTGDYSEVVGYGAVEIHKQVT